MVSLYATHIPGSYSYFIMEQDTRSLRVLVIGISRVRGFASKYYAIRVPINDRVNKIIVQYSMK